MMDECCSTTHRHNLGHSVSLQKYDTHTKRNDYLDYIFSFGFSPVITLPTRLGTSSATLIDHIYANKFGNCNY